MSLAKTPERKRIAIIGGGWAGCAAAAALTDAGHRVSLFEASRMLGGRARHVELNGRSLDNGQHILLGAYSATLGAMRLVGIDPENALLRLPLQMRYPDGCGGMDFAAPRLPAPLHMLAGLLGATGLAREDKLALARFSTTARWMGWTMHTDCTVTELLDRFDQTERLIRLMWRPLCIAALNTPPERASARIFLHVLRDSLGARRHASDMLIPRVDLSALFPLAAGKFVQERGGSVHLGAAVKTLRQEGNAWQIGAPGEENRAAGRDAGFDAVILATAPAQADALLAGVPNAPRLPLFEYEPITTCYLGFEGELAPLPRPFYALLDEPAAGQWGQFVFDRGQLDDKHRGVLAVVVSASTKAIALGNDALSAAVAAQLAQAFRRKELAAPSWTKVISEKRATFSCTPGLMRPACETGAGRLFLAGDYTASDYPATLESAVRSGIEAAGLAMQSFS
jgi:hydroxysqualene dehydroxylase